MLDHVAFDALIRAWTPVVESWAERMDRRHPGADFWPAAARSLEEAAAGYDPARGGFGPWLRTHLRLGSANTRTRWLYRMARAPRGPDSAAEPPARPDESEAYWRRVDSRMTRVVAFLDAPHPNRMKAVRAETVRRHYLGGESLTAIARTRGVGPRTESQRLARGLDELRLALGPADDN